MHTKRPTSLSFLDFSGLTMQLKDRIIHEALRQFSTKGYMATSTVDIIDAASTSKGGLYNHFKNKEQLFLEALSQARKIWRERNLHGLDEIERPVDKIIQILVNYRDRYLIDTENIPGGCVFVNLTVELSDQQPHLAAHVREGMERLKAMLKRLLDQEKANGTLQDGVDTDEVVHVLFSGLMGACVIYTADKSEENLSRTIQALIRYLEDLSC